MISPAFPKNVIVTVVSPRKQALAMEEFPVLLREHNGLAVDESWPDGQPGTEVHELFALEQTARRPGCGVLDLQSGERF